MKLSTKTAQKTDESTRTRLYGPPPVNIFTTLREDRGLSFQDLSQSSYIDVQALKRCEAGTYSNPLPTLVDYWCKRHAHLSPTSLESDYYDFIDHQRKRHELYFGSTLNVDPFKDLHPFRQLRSRRPHLDTNDPLPVGISEVSQALCVPLDTLQFFEKKWKTQQSVPKPLKSAFSQIGYTFSQVEKFQNDYQIWRQRLLHEGVTFNG